MGHGPQGYGPPIQPDITHRAGLTHHQGDHGDDGGLDGFFTQSLATTQSSGSGGGSFERDRGSDGELLALLDVFHTDSNNQNHHNSNNNHNNNHSSSQRTNGYDDPLGAPFPPHEGHGLGGDGYDSEGGGQGKFTSVTAVGRSHGQGQGHYSSSSSRGVGEEKGGGEGVGSSGGVDMKGLRWTTLDARYSDQLGADEAQVSAPSDRGWHSTTLLQGGGNQQAHVDAYESTSHADNTGHGHVTNDKRKGKGQSGSGGSDNGGMWWLNKCDGNVIVVFGGLRYVSTNSTQLRTDTDLILIASLPPFLPSIMILIRYKHNAVPEPFSSSDLHSRLNTFVGVGSVEVGVSDQDCLSDTYVYDTDNKAWYCSKATYKPAGRCVT